MLQQRRLRAAGTWRLAIAVAVLDLVIVAGLGFHLAGGTAIGSALSANGGVDPVALLGKDLGKTTCPTAPLAVGKGTTVICPDWTGVTTPESSSSMGSSPASSSATVPVAQATATAAAEAAANQRKGRIRMDSTIARPPSRARFFAYAAQSEVPM